MKSGDTEQRKKWAEPFTHFLKAGRMGRRVRRMDCVRPAGSIKQRSKAADGGIPWEERVNITGETGSGQYCMEEEDQIIDKNMEKCNDARERKR